MKMERDMFKKLVDFFFGCPHQDWSFPITMLIHGRKVTYCRCLQCGERRPYDWERMKFVTGEKGSDLSMCPNYGRQGVKP